MGSGLRVSGFPMGMGNYSAGFAGPFWPRYFAFEMIGFTNTVSLAIVPALLALPVSALMTSA